MKNTLITLLMLSSTFVFAQSNEANSWYNKDLKKDKIFGVSANRAYDELLVGRNVKPIIVAIIDGGTDINHNDIKNVIWENPNEVADDKIDNDNNGYIDDVHGWNFLGNNKGENVSNDNLEVTRVYRMLKTKYEKADSARLSSKKDFQLYLKCKKEVETKYDESNRILNNVKTIYENYKLSDSILTIYYRTKDYTLKQLKGNKVEILNPLVKFMIFWKNEKFDTTDIKKTIDHYKSQALYRYNVDYDPRIIIGDDWTNNSVWNYGNNDVVGMRAGHGTMVAGNVAAIRGNGIGPDGVTSNAQLMILQVVPDGDERDKDVANAILYAVNNGASIINMSFGKTYSPQKHLVDSALRVANQHDVLIIHAAGNDAENTDVNVNYPNNYDDSGKQINDKFMVIGASTIHNNKKLAASFSNYGKKTVDVFAPGENIYSCSPCQKYEKVSGTSMASPIAAGVATIIRAYFPELSAKEVKEILIESTEKVKQKVYMPGTKKKVKFSELCVSGGIINAYNAIILAEKKTQEKNKTYN